MTKTNNKKYFYSELEDQIIVNSIKEDFKKRQLERRNFELTWELNMNFYLGNQYSYISNTGELGDIEKNYYWENREVYNHIAPIIEGRLAKLNKIKPCLSIKSSSSTDDDLYSSKLAKSIIQSTLDKNNFSSLLSIASHWSEITGTSFYKITWDNELGDVIGKLENKIIKNGDVKISICSPFEIYPDSNGSIEINDCHSIIEARAFPVEYINQNWNLNLTGEDVDIYELNNQSFISNISGKSNITKISHVAKHDHVLVIERYEKPNSINPNGKLTIICQNVLLYDGDLPYIVGSNETRGYPFIKQVSIKQIACFWGMSVIERCIPIQRAYNAIKNKKHEYISRLASGVLTVEDGSVDVENLEDEGLAPGKILIYRNGSTPPQFLSPGTIPTELEREEDRLLSEINNLACISMLSTSSDIPTGVSSGSALELLISQDESRLSLTAENIRNSLVQIGTYIIRLYKQFATNARLNKITNNNGSVQIFYWNKNDLTSDDIILESNNELEESFTTKRQTILSLYEKGLLSDENGKVSISNKLKLLDMLGFKSWEGFEDINEMHKTRANKENLKLIDLSDPLEIDNHELHIHEHIKYIISDCREKEDKNFIKKLINHIKQHKTKSKINED